MKLITRKHNLYQISNLKNDFYIMIVYLDLVFKINVSDRLSGLIMNLTKIIFHVFDFDTQTPNIKNRC
jgi:hypothetical protein